MITFAVTSNHRTMNRSRRVVHSRRVSNFKKRIETVRRTT